MDVPEEKVLSHYGIIRKSGRYPWGSGGNIEARSRSFIDYIKELLGFGMSEKQIAEGLGFTPTEIKNMKTLAREQIKEAEISRAVRLKFEKQYTTTKIAEIMGKPESSVRSLLKAAETERKETLVSIADMLQRQVQEKTYVDVGKGVSTQLGISRERLNAAVQILESEGYVVHPALVDAGNNKIKLMALCPPGTTYQDVKANKHLISQVQEYTSDGGESWDAIQPPIAVSPTRVKVNYAEDGGDKADGVIFVRPGVKDLSMDGSQYAQVRIQVGNDHYLKGMAVLKPDLPDGVDLVFNTNKTRTDAPTKLDAMKKLKADPTNPFGSFVRQIKGEDGKVKSALNLVNEQGDWEDWSKTLSSQMLSKQPPRLAKQQLDADVEERSSDLDAIMKLTNPTVRKKLLDSYADGADRAAWLMKAKHMPGQANHVILPVPSMKPSEVYAPNYEQGTRVALVRFPHGGKFEIPELTVNNNQREAKSLIGSARDAIGINHKVAERLSGADFDGDTVLVIPNDKGQINVEAPLPQLKNFNAKARYKLPDDKPVKIATNTEMGKISNLITDMTIRGANNADLANAVKHSMVVIDAEKHNLNYRQSAIDNRIAALSAKYQTPYRETNRPGASTLISNRKHETTINKRRPRRAKDGGPIDPKTGKQQWEEVEPYTTKDGRTVYRKEKVKTVLNVDDVNKLSSGTKIESIYADYSNRMKALADKARKESYKTPNLKVNPSAKKVYANEIAELNRKLNVANANSPRERQARLLAEVRVKATRAANPDMDKAEIKKLERIALQTARNRVGAKKQEIEITDREWEAIQAGAITNHKLSQILNNADLDKVRKRAMPRESVLMDAANIARAKRLAASGATQAEIARVLGVSLTTLKEGLK